MKKPTYIVTMLIVAAGFFLAGNWYNRHSSFTTPAAGHKILYYTDPMNPGFRSEKPGLASCGMPLEPVYADSGQQTQSSRGVVGAAMPGVVQIKAGMEQLIGVKVEAVEKAPWSQTIRMPGKVVPDENRIFRITAATDGWVRKILPPTTDSLVRKDELLATFYAPEFFSGLKAYLYALRRTEASVSETEEQIQQTNANLENYKISLRNLGMSELQLDEIQRTKKGTDSVEIRSPAAGFILSRKISYGQRFEKGLDLYRIADLSQVWILADIYDNAAFLTKPGMRMEVSSPYLRKSFYASLTNIPPTFDPATRTLKLRLTADNPGYRLRPDMFVDVEFRVNMPAAITVPTDAVLDSGLKKAVFVEQSKGFFEPRMVETGRAFGNRIEIVSGLKQGERIAVSGTFLLDSESRMKTAAAGIFSTPRQDPSCGMYVDEAKSLAAGLTVESGGVTHYFCSVECKQKFLKKTASGPSADFHPASIKHDAGHQHD